jgi:hypothetical protein
MSEYVTQARGHDAEWLLQQELVRNDQIAAKERWKRRPRGSERINVSAIPLTPPSAGEEATAVRVARAIAARTGMGEDALREVLDALGLADQHERAGVAA